MSNGLRKIALAGCLIVAGKLTKTILETAYEKTTGDPPPKNPAADHIDWGTALLWSAAVGMVAGITKTSIRRVAAEANEGQPIEDQ